MKTSNELQKILQIIDHKSYPAYKDTKGSYDFGSYVLSINQVQGDAFASPSKLSISIAGAKAGFPSWMYDQPHKRITLQDHLTRLFCHKIQPYSFKAQGSGKSGLLSVSRCGQEVLERTACEINPVSGNIIVRFEVGFPAHGRTVHASGLMRILFDYLPECVNNTLFYRKIDQKKAEAVIHLSEDQIYIREQLKPLGLAAFIANGSILPRESGVSSRPMKQAVPFTSPDSFCITMDLPHAGKISGMGIPQGITLIVGGGYHGKSTLLKALELGVYNHIKGDGREYVITDASAVKIRAEDGRSIKKVDISMFIRNLPNKKDTVSFYTEDASGSTSQAANVIEAMESGSSLLLIDEDTCATNFMVRDELMQRVVHRDQEPITPFIERARSMYSEKGISCILVAGSSGSYFHIADYIIQMDQYVPKDITKRAKQEASAFPLSSWPDPTALSPSFQRSPKHTPELRNNSRIKTKTLGKDALQIDHETIELRFLEQLIDSEQVAALGTILLYAEKNLLNGRDDLQKIIEIIRKKLDQGGLAAICSGSTVPGNLAMPRNQEIFACFNRYRLLKL